MLKLSYITAQVPWGRGETFIIDEMLAVKEAGAELLIIPRNPPKEVFHQEAHALLENAVWLPLLNLKMVGIFLISLLTKPCLWTVLGSILRQSRNRLILAKNLTVVPKGVHLSHLLKKEGVEHIHAHWGSTTATMAYVTSQLSGIPWSFTLHRWDITENNMLKEKVKIAEFVRCISETGRRETLQIVGYEFEDKIKLIHMGVDVPYPSVPARDSTRARNSFTIVCPANLLEVKGHRFLIAACSLLIGKGITNFRCLLLGEGHLKREIGDMIQKEGLEKHVEMPGAIPHEKLMNMYDKREVDTVVLPSVNTVHGDKEGIPVALMEAMAYGVPVVSTNTGGIPELLSDGAGIMVEEQDSEQLADVIDGLIEDSNLAGEIGEKGYRRIEQQFDVHKNAGRLLGLIRRSKSLEP